jgi:hypothetical protein
MPFQPTHKIVRNDTIRHYFPIDSEVERVANSDAKMHDGAIYHQYVDSSGKSQYVVQSNVVELKPTLTSGEIEEKRVKYLYVVTGRDGENYIKTFDRDFAREVKAMEGGKKAGVIITAYAPVKEIR